MREYIKRKLIKLAFYFLFTEIIKFNKKFKRKDGRMSGKYGLEIRGKMYILEYELLPPENFSSL